MPAATLISVSEYLSTTYRPDCDYVDGYVVERNVGEREHSRTQGRLIRYLMNREERWGIVVFPEQRVQVGPMRFRIPDVCVVAGPEPEERILTHPPFLCIEILSRDDTFRSLQKRIDDYLAFGVSSVWALEPRTNRARIYTRAGIQEVTDGVLRTADPEITVPLTEIFVA